jgi:hypothetical protein
VEEECGLEISDVKFSGLRSLIVAFATKGDERVDVTCRSGTKGELIGGEIRLGGPWEEVRTPMGGSSVNLT